MRGLCLRKSCDQLEARDNGCLPLCGLGFSLNEAVYRILQFWRFEVFCKMVTKIETALKALGGGVFLMDYPPQAASLAKLSKIDNFRASSERPSGGLSPCERGLSPLASKEGAILYRIVKGLYHSDPSVDLVFTILTHRSVWY